MAAADDDHVILSWVPHGGFRTGTAQGALRSSAALEKGRRL
jgi:hypothetical protein